MIIDFLLKGEVWNDIVELFKLDYYIKGLKVQINYSICVEVMYYFFIIFRSEYLEIEINRNFLLIFFGDYKGEVGFYSVVKVGGFFSYI